METDNLFSLFDYGILAVTLLTPLAVGFYYGIVNKKTTEDLLVGGRKMHILPVAASIMATTVSAITVLGYPAEVYSYGIQIFQMALVSIIFIPISVYLFVPYFYNLKLTSVYEYLELRFDSVGVRLFASFAFIFQNVVLSGIVLYAPSIAMEAFLGLSPMVTVVGIGIAGTIYTSVGGLKAVVWTDTFQLVLMYFGIIAILIRSFIVAGGVSRAFKIASDDGRLNLFDFTADPFMRHNFINFFIGFGVTYLLQPGVRQHEVQRYSSLPNLEAAKRSVLLSIPIKVLALGISLCTGVGIYAVYAGCDPIALGDIRKGDEVVPYFVIKELGFLPGMLGLFTSCLFCGVLSSYSSALNGMVAVTWKDFLSKLSVCQKMEEQNRSRLSMAVGIMYGIITVTLAMLAKKMGNVYQASYAVTGPSAGVLGAVFLMALFMPFVCKRGALGGMIIGLGTTVFICFQAFIKKVPHAALGFSTSNCSSYVEVNHNLKPQLYEEVEWPDKMYTMSYLLYPAFSGFMTLASGMLISVFARAFTKKRAQVNPIYLHPILQKYYSAKEKPRIDNDNCVKFEMQEAMKNGYKTAS